MTAMTAAQTPGDEVWLPAGLAAPILGVKPRSMRRYDSRWLTVRRTPGGHRRYLLAELVALADSLKSPAQVAS